MGDAARLCALELSVSIAVILNIQIIRVLLQALSKTRCRAVKLRHHSKAATPFGACDKLTVAKTLPAVR